MISAIYKAACKLADKKKNSCCNWEKRKKFPFSTMPCANWENELIYWEN